MRAVRRPSALGLIALAFAVAFCGLGHRLAAYLHHGSQVNRATVTRFWLETRNDSIAAVHRIEGKNRFLSDSQPLAPASRQFRRLQCESGGAPPMRRSRPPSLSFLIPFRSPPPNRLFLA